MMSQSFRLRFRAFFDSVRLRFRAFFDCLRLRFRASLDKFSAKFADRIGERIILYTKDVAERDGIIHLPIYMAMFL
jgi:hypothetical protein